MEKDKTLIPEGPYCYTYDDNDVYILCPYWRRIPERPEQYDGFCDYLEKGDIELSKEMIFMDMQTNEEVMGDDLPFPAGLLWDQCKECGINDRIDEQFI